MVTVDRKLRASVALQIALAICIVLLLAPITWAETYTWDGGPAGSDQLWSNAANWNLDGAPLSSNTTAIVFAGTNNPGTLSTPLNQNLAAPFVLNSLTFNNTASTFFYLTGGALRFEANGGVQPSLVNSGSQNKWISNAIEVPEATVLAATNNTYTIDLTGPITGAGSIVKSGGGVVSLLNAGNSFSGGLTFNGTTANASWTSLLIRTNGAQGTGLITLNGGNTTPYDGDTNKWPGGLVFAATGMTVANHFSLQSDSPVFVGSPVAGNSSSSATFSGNFDLNGKTLYLRGLGTGTVNGQISGNGGLTKLDTGTWLLNRTNSYAGSTTIKGGTIKLGTDNALPGATTVTLDGTTGADSTLDLNGHSLTVTGLTDVMGASARRVVNSGSGTPTLTVNNSAEQTFAGTLGDAGQASFDLIKAGSGRLILAGANAYTGTTVVQQNGVLRVQHGSALGDTTAGTTVALGGQLEVMGGISVAEPLTISGGGNSPNQWGGVLRSLDDGNTCSGQITLATGSNRIGMMKSGVFNLTGGITEATGISGSVQFAGASNGTIVISNQRVNIRGGLGVVDNTTLRIDVAGNSWGGTGINYGGVLKLGIDDAMPTNTVVSLGSSNNTHGTVDLNGFSQTIAGLTDVGTGNRRILNSGSETSTLTVNNSSDYTFAGSLGVVGQDSFNLVKNGPRTFTLSGVNTYSGTTTVNSGRLLIDGSLSSSGGDVTVNGGVLGGRGSLLRKVNVNPGAILAPGASTGTLHTGSVAFTEGSIFEVELGSSGYDQLDVIGSVQLDNATLDLSLLFAPILGAEFVLINNDGEDSVIGTFKDLQEGAPVVLDYDGQSFLFHLTYAGGTGSNDVVLSAVPEPSGMLLAVAGLLGLVALRRR